MMISPYLIAPSLLSANFAQLGEEVSRVITAGADWIHFDVMDNHYVPNLTVGPMVCEAVSASIRALYSKDKDKDKDKNKSKSESKDPQKQSTMDLHLFKERQREAPAQPLPLVRQAGSDKAAEPEPLGLGNTLTPIDVHLMVRPVDRIVPDFAKAGANIMTFHPEASEHIDRTLALIRDHGCQAGLAFNPATSLHYLDHVMDRLDLILIMSVNPGFGGQLFIPETLNKLQAARARIHTYFEKTGRTLRLQVDGGIHAKNIAQIAAAGADTFVAGSAIFGHTDSDYRAAIHAMRDALATLR